MKTRLIILVVAAVGLAAVWAFRSPPPPDTDPFARDDGEPTMDVPDGVDPDDVVRSQKLIWEQHRDGDFTCTKAPEPADVAVTIEAEPSGSKNRLWLYLTEAHGYFAGYIVIDIWYTGGDPSVTSEDSLYSVEIPKNIYIPANETARTCFEFNPAELERVGGELGTSSDWRGEVRYVAVTCVENPTRMPVLAAYDTCK